MDQDSKNQPLLCPRGWTGVGGSGNCSSALNRGTAALWKTCGISYYPSSPAAFAPSSVIPRCLLDDRGCGCWGGRGEVVIDLSPFGKSGGVRLVVFGIPL